MSTSSRIVCAEEAKKSGVASSDILRLWYNYKINTAVCFSGFYQPSQSPSNGLEKVQRRVVSVIYPNCSYEEALKVAGID